MTATQFSDLADRNVFITGGGSGIGAAFVKGFAGQGARVGFVSLSKEPAEALCDDVAAATGHRPLFIPCDISDVAALQAAIAEIRAAHGPTSVVINNAARDTRHDVTAYTPAEWDTSMNTNLRPHFFTIQAALEDLRATGGSVINLGSNASVLGLAGYASYVAAKSAIVGLTKALARELGPDGIRVNALLPGWVLTERQKALWATPEAIEACLAQQSLKSLVSEDDITNAALFLASNACRSLTGQAIIVDGGRA